MDTPGHAPAGELKKGPRSLGIAGGALSRQGAGPWYCAPAHFISLHIATTLVLCCRSPDLVMAHLVGSTEACTWNCFFGRLGLGGVEGQGSLGHRRSDRLVFLGCCRERRWRSRCRGLPATWYGPAHPQHRPARPPGQAGLVFSPRTWFWPILVIREPQCPNTAHTLPFIAVWL